MKIIKAILVLSLFFPYSAEAANILAVSASRADVARAIASGTYGDTITVPACAEGNCVWTSGIEITKDIKIIGNGIDSTILTLGFTDNSSFEGFFEFTPDATSRSRLNKLNGEGTFEITGFSFIGKNRMKNKFGVYINNSNTTTIRRVKIHDNKYTSIHRAVYPVGNVYGVFYDNQLTDSNGSYPIGYETDSWNNNALTLGSGDGWYIEDNTFSFPGGDGIVSGGGHGMGHVVRYNTISSGSHDLYVESHGNQTGGVKGTQITEIYGNDFSSTCSQQVFDMRGGKCMVFFNDVNDTPFYVREEYSDATTGTLLDNACVEAGPQICADNCVCMKVNNSYFWNNRKDSVLIGFSVSQDTDMGVTNEPPELVEGREFWNHDDTFDGTSGVGCGTLAARPATCTTGVGYWATEQNCTSLSPNNFGAHPTTPISGTLYRCTSTNTWEAYYTPYTYPHPLRGEGIADNPGAPQGLKLVVVD